MSTRVRVGCPTPGWWVYDDAPGGGGATDVGSAGGPTQPPARFVPDSSTVCAVTPSTPAQQGTPPAAGACVPSSVEENHQLDPAYGAVSGVAYIPQVSKYYGVWTAAIPYIKVTTKNADCSTSVSWFGKGDTYSVESDSSTGPWSLLSNNLLQVPAGQCFTYGATTIESLLFVATNVGVFASYDFGRTYKFIGGPTDIYQIVSWGSTLFACAVTKTDAGYYSEVFMSTNRGVGWSKIFSVKQYGLVGNWNSLGPSVWNPIVVPLDNNPVIIYDSIYSISVNAGTVSYFKPYPLASMSMRSPANIGGTHFYAGQPIYLGKLNGQHYIAIDSTKCACFSTTDEQLYLTGAWNVFSQLLYIFYENIDNLLIVNPVGYFSSANSAVHTIDELGNISFVSVESASHTTNSQSILNHVELSAGQAVKFYDGSIFSNMAVAFSDYISSNYAQQWVLS